MRPIDADALKEMLIKERDAIPLTKTERYGFGVEFPDPHGTSMRGGINKAFRCMEQTPTIDAVPVVRCKDCKWYEPCTDCGFDEVTGRRDHSKIVEKPYGECHGQDFHFTEDGCLRVGVDDFCSYGERRSDE